MSNEIVRPIQVGDHVRLSFAMAFGFVRKHGSIGQGKGVVKGFLVWTGEKEEFFPEEDTVLLWTREQLEEANG